MQEFITNQQRAGPPTVDAESAAKSMRKTTIPRQEVRHQQQISSEPNFSKPPNTGTQEVTNPRNHP